MNKNNKKGFTLVEVLVVIVILAILSTIAIVAISKYMQEGKNDYNQKLKTQLLLAGKSYYGDNKKLLPTANTPKKFSYVTVPTMKDGRYLKNELVDSEGRDCSDSYVYVKQTGFNTGKYEYIPCLICTDKNGQTKTYDDEKTPYCDITAWGDDKAPTCSYKQLFYDEAVSTDWTIKDANDDQKIAYIIIRNKDNHKKYVAFNVKNKTTEEIRKIDIQGIFREHFNEQETGDYEVILLDAGGNESRKSCLDFYIVNNSCKADWSGDQIVIKKATSKGFEGIYYKVGNNSPVKVLDATGRKLTNKYLPANAVPLDADVFVKDKRGNDIPCAITGIPTCKFTKVPGNTPIGKSGTFIEVECSISDGTKVQIKDLKKITVNTSKGLGKINTAGITHNGGEYQKATVLKLKIPYTPNNSMYGTETVTFGLGTVKNAVKGYENKVNRPISTSFTVDSVPPKIEFVVSGEIGNATALTDHGVGYKNAVTVTTTCTDNSGLSSFKVNNINVASPYTVTYSARGNASVITECTDKAGNVTNKTGGPYRVLKQITDCSICGVSEYGSCPNKVACGCK